MTRLWEGVAGSEPRLQRWLGGQVSELEVARLPRSAWAIVAGSVARACAERGNPLLVLVPGPDRFADELRMWLAGRPATHVFAEVAVSFLDRPPAFDEAVNRRLEALTALLDAEREPVVVVSSRRAITRQTISRHDLAESTVVLAPGRGPDPVTVAGRLVELGYSREPLVEERGQFSLRGGILDVYPSAADAPMRAEWAGDTVETLRLFDPENQRSVMAVREAVIRTGRELLLGPDRGEAAVERLHATVSLDKLRGDVRSEWDDQLTRLGVGAAFPGVDFYAAYLDPSRPSLLDHIREDAVVLDFEPERQRLDAKTLLDETSMLAAAEVTGGELPRGFVLPAVEAVDDLGPRPRVSLTAGEGVPDAISLGWFEGEPLVGQARALAGYAARTDAATVVFATEQDERLRALLDEAGVKAALKEVDLDADLELAPGLHHAALDLPAGCAQPQLGIHLATDAELFGRLRRPSRGRSRTRTADLTR